jgi:hypothetical protein
LPHASINLHALGTKFSSTSCMPRPTTQTRFPHIPTFEMADKDSTSVGSVAAGGDVNPAVTANDKDSTSVGSVTGGGDVHPAFAANATVQSQPRSVGSVDTASRQQQPGQPRQIQTSGKFRDAQTIIRSCEQARQRFGIPPGVEWNDAPPGLAAEILDSCKVESTPPGIFLMLADNSLRDGTEPFAGHQRFGIPPGHGVKLLKLTDDTGKSGLDSVHGDHTIAS